MRLREEQDAAYGVALEADQVCAFSLLGVKRIELLLPLVSKFLYILFIRQRRGRNWLEEDARLEREVAARQCKEEGEAREREIRARSSGTKECSIYTSSCIISRIFVYICMLTIFTKDLF